MIKGLIQSAFLKSKKNNEENYLKQNSKEHKDSAPIKNPKKAYEELRSLAQINTHVGQLNGVKGVYIQEVFTLSNMFSWNTSNVFEIHEGDSQGRRLYSDSKPILYSVAKLEACCSCKCSEAGASEMAITTQLNDTSSVAPYLFLQERNNCCGYNSCLISINDNGNGTQVGKIQLGYCNSMTVSSNYTNGLEIKYPKCQCSCNQVNYSVSDDDGNKAVLIQKTNCCNCNNPYTYELGFPPNYNQDQNQILLASTIFLGYVNYQQRKNDNN
ncbi:hypothetical protein TTHERM_00760820 (macronuclear) [Tetrahymena thermophila SB210]|uniref:Phospholipid scramblase n=1 Tax=Tetrahymena thermophila (strain SB210) TaxID=312017 RepID=I7LZJ2_TETTS|nr:hypothetical protein TTHERM_00760820 [Tetrahymena thermophila SB210]EAR84035.1 hypothetical protein TTHERM_00760820 [Tetrahymena thermophila SB210]|eukprot:XP_001031698.1 hypothetical protein TTHERM_00760820 [Tetrahymena thermophila SB210]